MCFSWEIQRKLVWHKGCIHWGNMKTTKNTGLPSWKRVLDVCGILVMLPVLLPVALVMAVIIRAISTGPVLFRQERIGYQGCRFTCLKFRTMFQGSETATQQVHFDHLVQADAPMTKMDAQGDKRIIPFGRIMRAAGLDEIPQLINVLKGEMSLTGPRPCLPGEVERFIPWQHERFEAVPGLTGLWQVSGKNRLTFNQMVQLDIHYVKTMSLWLDLKIIAMTLPALAFQMWDMNQNTIPATKLIRVGKLQSSEVWSRQLNLEWLTKNQ